MILRGIVSSPPVQGVTVQDPIDQGAPQGFSAVGMGGWWTALPTPSYAFAALGTLGLTGNIDWSLAGYYTLTLTGSDTLVLTFATTSTAGNAAAAQIPSYTLGQTIKLWITGAASAVITWPTTINWVGVIATPAVSAAAPVFGAGVNVEVTLTCTGTGSAPQFNGTYLTG